MTDVVCYYYDPVKAPLLRAGVLPAIEAAQREHPGLAVHLERHWLHGPHVRVRLDGAEPAAAFVARRLAGHLLAHPSNVAVDDLIRQSHDAGRAERVPPPYTPIHPDNTVRMEPSNIAPMVRRLGSIEAVACRTAVLRLGVRVVRASVEALGVAGDSSAARVRLTVGALAAHSGRYPLGFCGLVLDGDPDATLRARLDQIWDRQADTLTELVARVADGCAANTGEADWLMWTIEARQITEIFQDKGLLPTTGHRFTAGLLDELLTLCDVTPVERYLSVNLVTRAAERLSDLDGSFRTLPA